MADEQAQTPGGEPAEGDANGASEASAGGDPWAPYDAVLEGFGRERGVALGTLWHERPADAVGRFVGWDNAAGWRCTVQLVRVPAEQAAESAVMVVVQGPPLPGNRARAMVLGGFGAEVEAEMLRAILELGYGIGETWGPMAESPPPAPPPDAGTTEPTAAASAAPESTTAASSAPESTSAPSEPPA